ncbi:MAG: CRISPR-associated endonuclease Cas1 [Bacteroidota bacterium]|nr:MAG: CRISPR-associated endonuclease Cas1 [Bacteroidota bacterium]
MIILLNQYAVKLNIEAGVFCISSPEVGDRKVSPYKVKAFHVYKSASITTGAMLLANKHQIPIIIHENNYQPAVRIHSTTYGNHPHIRRQQCLFSASNNKLDWCKQNIIRKAEGQAKILVGISLRGQHGPEFQRWEVHFNLAIQRLVDGGHELQEIRMHEAQISKAYWHLLSLDMRKFLPFSCRNFHPAKDEFNAALNYLYGMLYNQIETAALSAGLDPQVGFMHADQYGSSGLVYDLIEPYRPVCDELLLKLAHQSKVTVQLFEKQTSGCTITESGIAHLVQGYLKRMTERETYKGKQVRLKDKIVYMCFELARYLTKEFDFNA